MKFVLALDQGTTSSRAIIFNSEGNIVAQTQKELAQHFPQLGWVEHDALDIWRDQLLVAQQALEKAQLSAADIAAIGITNQRETTILWDRATGQPLHRAIVWQDRRTADICERLQAEGLEAIVREKTGLVLDPYFSATKLQWLLDTIPNAREQAERGELAFGTVDTWLMWNLSGGKLHITDPSNASRTSLFNIHTGEWDDELLRLFNIPRSVLPSVVRSSGHYGETSNQHFGAPIVLGGMAGDQQAALFGQACHHAGQAKNTYGTGCFLLMHTCNQAVASHNGLITTCAAQIGDLQEYALEGSVFIGGAAVQWLRDGLGIIKTADEIETLAARVGDSGGVYFVPAFAGLGAPYWNPHTRGTLVGINRGTTAAHIARAALEAIAFQSAELFLAMQADCANGGVSSENLGELGAMGNLGAMRALGELRVDGGASANALLMQFQADLLGSPVVRPHVVESTALGAAYLAGLAVGVWKDQADIAACIVANCKSDQRYTPNLSPDVVAARMSEWRRAVRSAIVFAEK